jgi:teichuronic acid exporter
LFAHEEQSSKDKNKIEMSTLKQKTMSGMFWTVSERISLQAVQLVVSIIIARVLEPSEFGLIGMLAIFTSVAQAILDSGFGSALIQKKDADDVDASSIFYFNLFIGVILAILLAVSAPLIAQFYRQPILVNVLRVLSLGLIINGFSLVQTTILTKNLEFKTQMKVNLIAAIGSGLIGIIMAVQGFGVWALVAQILTRKLFTAILLWWLNSWRPLFTFSFNSLKSMFTFGSNMLVTSVIGTIFNNLHQAFIGRVFSAAELGFFTKATTIESSINHVTSTSLKKVMYPAMVPLQDDMRKLKQAYRKTIRLSLFLHLPMMIGLSLTSEPLILFFLTEKWAGSIPFLQLLSFVGIFYPLTTLNLNIIIVKGRSKTYMHLQNINRALTILLINI